jgi:type II secretory pathway pseudopilin PulG
MSSTQSILTVSRRAAVTLMETVVSVLIVGVMLLAAMETIGAFARDTGLQQDQCKATALAQELLSEIVQSRYADPNTEAGETRATWDDVSDYDNRNENPPTSRAGSPLTGYTGWQRTVRVRFVDPSNPGTQVGSDAGLKRIAVTVVSPGGKSTVLTGLRSKQGVYERPPTTQKTYASWADITVQVSSDAATTCVAGVNLMNQVP